VHCWGGGERGKLGLGNEEDSHIPQRVVALEDKTVCQLSCGTFHTLGVTTDGMVYAWGSGKDGKLGLGDVAYCPYFERDSSGQPFVSKPHLITALAPVSQNKAGHGLALLVRVKNGFFSLLVVLISFAAPRLSAAIHVKS
jgi:hypothetical protein